MKAFGGNELGQLATGAKGNAVLTPIETRPGWDTASRLIASASHSVAVFGDYANGVGGDRYGTFLTGTKTTVVLEPIRLGLEPFTGLAIPEAHILACFADGHVETGGGNAAAQAGVGTSSTPYGAEELKAPGCYDTPQHPFISPKTKAVAGGQYHSLALTVGGQMVAWGMGQHGQLGNGTNKHSLTPIATAHLIDPLVALDGGSQHTIALRADGRAMGCGLAKQGQFGVLGQPDVHQLTLIPGVQECIAIAAGGEQSLFLIADGTLKACGRGQALHDVGLTNVTAIACGDDHVLAVAAGEVCAWNIGVSQGLNGNGYGQVGDGTRIEKPSPVPLGIEARMVAGGSFHSLAL